jgi:Raf kinase inhibitor-like YbhB/YbcL family protein
MVDSNLAIGSPAFTDGGLIPIRYTADGDNINPPLVISGVGQQVRTLVLIVDDPDAANDPDGPGKTYDHWVVFNIPPKTRVIEEDSFPDNSVVGKNSSGKNSYFGPSPPNGTHSYHFKLYALSQPLTLNENVTKQDVEAAMEDKVIAQASLIGRYAR